MKPTKKFPDLITLQVGLSFSLRSLYCFLGRDTYYNMAYYFKHDDNARRDPKLIRLRRIKGMKGIGIYWCLIEIMHEQEGTIKVEEINSIAFELQEDEININSILKDFDLFVIRQYEFCNTRVLESLEERYEKSRIAKQNVKKRWDRKHAENEIVNTVVLPKSYNGNTIREEKRKEDNIEFDKFWEIYNKKESKEQALKSWNKLTNDEKQKALLVCSDWIKIKITDKQFQPLASTWLNKKRFNDEINFIKSTVLASGNSFTYEELQERTKSLQGK